MANQFHNIIQTLFPGKQFETKELAHYRKALLMNVTGEILELGIGTGVNLAYYPKSVQRITGVDQEVKELRSQTPVTEHYYGSYEELPFEANSFDTVVVTFVLGRVTQISPVLEEIKRVLKPRGRLIFMENGRSEKQSEFMLQDLVNPLWDIFSGRVLNRDYFEVLKEHGFLVANHVRTKVTVTQKALLGTLYMGVAVNVK